MAETLVEIRNGEALRQTLTGAGMSYAVLAAQVGVSYQRIGQLVDESYPNIKAATAAKIEDVLAVPRGTLFAPLANAELYGEGNEGSDGIVRDA